MTAADLPFRFVDDVHSVQDAGALIVRVPRRARGKEKLLGALAHPLQFPRYFGWNWDALDECLRDLSWLTHVKNVVIVHESLPFSSQSEQLATYLALLAGAKKFRASQASGPKLDIVFPEACRAAVLKAISRPGE